MLVWVDSCIPHSHAIWLIIHRVLSCHTWYGLGAYEQTLPMKIGWSTDKIWQNYAACALLCMRVWANSMCHSWLGLCSIKLNMCVSSGEMQGFDCMLECAAFQFRGCQKDACFVCLLMRFQDAEGRLSLSVLLVIPVHGCFFFCNHHAHTFLIVTSRIAIQLDLTWPHDSGIHAYAKKS
jgi:hypothetical protein